MCRIWGDTSLPVWISRQRLSHHSIFRCYLEAWISNQAAKGVAIAVGTMGETPSDIVNAFRDANFEVPEAIADSLVQLTVKYSISSSDLVQRYDVCAMDRWTQPLSYNNAYSYMTMQSAAIVLWSTLRVKWAHLVANSLIWCFRRREWDSNVTSSRVQKLCDALVSNPPQQQHVTPIKSTAPLGIALQRDEG
jgi:hypothetical protein